jgi:hypothetical protein
MIETGLNQRVKIQNILANQLPEYLRIENPKSIDFLKQYYLGQENRGSSVDLVDGLVEYLKLDSYTNDIVSGSVTLSADVSATDTTISLSNTRGYPRNNGIVKIDSEIIYYTEATDNSIIGCVRGFSGIENYIEGEVVFSSTLAASHSTGVSVTNLSNLFLKEFFRKLKISYAPGFEDESFESDVDINNFIKGLRSFYNSKGTQDSFNILTSVLFGKRSTIKNQTDALVEPSIANYRNRLFLTAEAISGDPLTLSGQTLIQDQNTQNLEIVGASAPISEVEFSSISADGQLYNLFLFSRFSDPAPGFDGKFSITPYTKTIEEISAGSKVLSVDTTIGFAKSGTLVVGNQTVTYTDKTINQFLGCSGIDSTILANTAVRTNDIAYSTNPNTGERVELRITGVISDFLPNSDIFYSDLNEVYQVKSLGRKVKDPSSNKTDLQILANSWQYNTASRIKVKTFFGSTFTLEIDVDKAYLRDGDTVEVLNRADGEILVESASVTVSGVNQVILSGSGVSSLVAGIGYDIRRKVKKAVSIGNSIENGNNVVISDILNTYVDKKDENLYVASNSLPSYNIEVDIIKSTIDEATVVSAALQDFDATTQKYNVLSFPDVVQFITGDAVVYSAGTSADPISGLVYGTTYYVEVLSPANKVKLYAARSFIVTGENLQFDEPEDGNTGSHDFTLAEQYNKKIAPQKVFRRIPVSKSLDVEDNVSTVPGTIGILINGVEVVNYKTDDKVYYGPLNQISVLNGGKEYSVTNPPLLKVVSPDSGTTALAYPAITGSLKNIYIDPQEFGLNSVSGIDVKGGNGVGALVEPIVEDEFREIDFNASLFDIGGGINWLTDTITTIKNHNLGDGTAVVYVPNGNKSPSITGFGLTTLTGRFLETGTVYYTEIVTSNSIRLYENLQDYNAGINTVGFSTGSESAGQQTFRLLNPTKKITGVNVLNPGSGYSTRKIAISTLGVSTFTNTLSFTNHGYSTGELITYEYDGDPIVGIQTTAQFVVTKIDNNNFRITNAGVGGTTLTLFERGSIENFTGVGTGFHIFNYPEVQVEVNVTIANTVGVITATPVITGPIQDVLLYEKGGPYGTTVLNFEKNPSVTVLNGKGAEFVPVIVDGEIRDVNVTNEGEEYYSLPIVEAVSPTGTGAILRPVINGAGKVIDIIVIRRGQNYNFDSTTIKVTSQGSGAILKSSIRDLTINQRAKFDDDDSEVLLNRGDDVGFQYGVVGINSSLIVEFNDIEDTAHSPLIGWAYDGNPIYGSKGYEDPNDGGSDVIRLVSGYEVDSDSVIQRPTGFPDGFFIEDYKFTDAGNLDIHNGRFCKTPDYPNGVYAYFTVNNFNAGTGELESVFPYVIGDSYKSSVIRENLIGSSETLSQDFDFNSSDLLRNTFPYVVSEEGGGYDFYVEPYKLTSQRTIVNNTKVGGIDEIEILNSGTNYQVGDTIIFNNEETTGSSAAAEVSEIFGQKIDRISNETIGFSTFVFSRANPNQVRATIGTFHSLEDGTVVKISGLSTYFPQITGFKKISVFDERFGIQESMPAESVGGMKTDIKISPIPKYVRPDTEITIEGETLKVLNVYGPSNNYSPYNSVLRAVRGISTDGHLAGAAVTAKPSDFYIDVDGENFNSSPNDKVYFNPNESVGFGTTSGGHVSIQYEVLGITSNRSIPIQSIYIEDHPFKNNQRVKFGVPSGANVLGVSTVSSASTFAFPEDGISQEVFISNRGKNTIGIKTTLNSDILIFNANPTLYKTVDSESFEYFIESIPNKEQIIGKVDRLSARVSTAQTHQLTLNDSLKIDIETNLSRGVGSASSISVIFDEDIRKILFDPIGFGSDAVNAQTSEITLVDHGLETGDKLYYKGPNNPDPLENPVDKTEYFVFVVDKDKIQLGETYIDVIGNNPRTIGLGTTGGSGQSLSIINPEIQVVRNNNLVFDVSDTSLSGYELKFFFDQNFRNELVGTGKSTSFEVSGVGTVGAGGTESITIEFNENIPEQIYYNLLDTANNILIEPDQYITNHSRILYVDSKYHINTVVVGVATTSFLVALFETPEQDEYTPSSCDKLSYTTRSKTGLGGINKIKILNKGFNYEKTPGISTITTSQGVNAELSVTSDEIGKLNSFRIEKPGFEFSQDKTLQPVADIPTYYDLENFNTVESVDIVFGGTSFVGTPKLQLVNSVTAEVINDAELLAVLNEGGGSIDDVEIIKAPSGLAGVAHSIYSSDNSNGLTIIEADSVNTGVLTVKIVTPLIGFATNPLNAGDEVYVDGIEKYTDPEGNSDGDGFNSANYRFEFFKVQNFNGGVNPAQITFDLTGFTTNPGIAKTVVNFGSVVKRDKYPLFKVNLKSDIFTNNERLLLVTSVGNVETDLFVTKTTENGILKTLGDYELQVGDVVLGKVSGTKATIKKIISFDGFYEVDSGVQQNFGWSNFKGFLNDDTQVIPDNDYYQKLAYAVKTEVEWEDLVDPMNRMVHISGTKNFVDTSILNNVDVGIGTTAAAESSIVVDIIEELPVYAQRFFDFAVDTDVVTNSPKVTNSIKFGNKKLTTFIECVTNRVLIHDDISKDFADSDNLENKFTDFLIYPSSVGFNRFFIVITSREDRTHFEIVELVVSNDNSGNTFNVERIRVKSNGSVAVEDDELESLGEIEAVYDEISGAISMRFTPTNPLKAYDIKAFRSLFDSRTDGTGSRILQDNLLVGNSDQISAGVVTSLVSFGITEYNGSYSTVEMLNETTGQKQFAEISLLHDGISETYLGQYGFDSSEQALSYQPIGTFGSSVFTDTDGKDKFSLDFTNGGTGTVTIKSRTVGFGTGGAGIGSVSFRLSTQDDMTERTARLESNTFDEVLTGAGVSIVGLTTLADRVAKSVVRIGVGETQVMTSVVFAQDPGLVESFTLEYPQIGVNTSTGIGTFTGRYQDKYAYLEFIPDAAYVGATARIEQYSEILYSDQDTNSTLIDDFAFGTVLERVVQGIYQPADQLEFELLHEGFPIYAHRFDPGNPSVFRLSDGRITIPSHFLQSGQELRYSEGTNISGLSSSKIGIGTTLAGGGSFEGDVRAGDKVISGVSTTVDIVIGQEIEGQGVQAAATVVSIGTTYIFFNGNSFGTTLINGIGNHTLLQLGDTVTDLDTNTGFGTITAIGINSIVVDNNVPVGVGSTYFVDRVGLAVSMSLVSTATTAQQVYRTGVTTDIIPDSVYAIRVDNDNIRLATKKDFAISGIGLEVTSRGLGNFHLLDTTKKLTKTIITIDGVVQNPISRTSIEYNLQENIGASRTYFALSGIATINSQDILKIGEEFMQVVAVGIATSTFGPITGIGSFNVAQVQRAYVGTSASSYSDGELAIVHKGAYNIEENSIFFTEAPTGAGAGFVLDDRNLPVTRSSFSGRTYLRQDYALNEIYDDVSPSFTGLGQTFNVTVGGQQPVGLETAASGSGIVFINGLYQGQTTQNNPLNVYSIEVDPVTDEVQYKFSGNKLISGELFVSETDPVANELPTGGRIISIGFSGGRGIAPLVPAKVIAEVGAGGTIVDIIGVDTTGPLVNITGFDYTHQTGVATVTTSTNHNLQSGWFAQFENIVFECPAGGSITTTVFPDERGIIYNISNFEYDKTTGLSTITTSVDHNIAKFDQVNLSNIEFTCAAPHAGVTTTIFPDGTQGTKYFVIDVPAANQLTVNVGISTIDHTYDTGGEVYGVKNTGPYSVDTVISNTQFSVNVGIVGFAHTYVSDGTVARYYDGLNFGQGYFNTASVSLEEDGHEGTVAVVDATIPFNEHRFESAATDAVTGTGGPYTPTDGTYDPVTGDLTLTIAGHSLTAGVDQVGLATESICFSCLQDNNTKIDCYPREVGGRGLPDPAYNTDLDISATTTDTITINVGEAQGGKFTGGRLKFDITNPGTGYTSPTVNVSTPSYGNLPIEGVFRTGIGSTTQTGQGLLVDIKAGAAKTTGIGTEFFIAENFSLQSRGFGFKVGDQFKPVGIVTGAFPSNPYRVPSNNPGYAGTAYEDVIFEVLQVFDDSFSSWNFGQVDYIDSIRSLQNGVRTRFPLALNGSLLSFQKNTDDEQSILVDLDSVLLIFVNGVIQQPKKDYFFEGGTSFNFNFTSAPQPNDDIKIYFFRGQRGVDSVLVQVDEVVKPGDKLILEKLDPNNVATQSERIIFGIEDSEQVETNIYRGLGIDDALFRPITLLPQKRDLILQEDFQYKIRDSLQSQIKPNAKVIGDFSTSEDFIFVDDAEFFQYEEDADGSNVEEVVPDCLVVKYNDPVSAAVTVTVSATGTISTATIVSGGSGYTDGTVSLSIANPPKVDDVTYGLVGVGTTAILTGTAAGGSLTAIGIVDPGFGYTSTRVPNVMVEIPTVDSEKLESCDVIIGYSGIITGIGTTTGTGGHPLALKLYVDLIGSTETTLFGTLKPDYKIFVKDTTIGTGVTSVNANDTDVIGIGTQFLNNVYHVNDFSFELTGTGEITCNIKSDTDIVGLAATSSTGVGKFSWGLIGGFKRQVLNPISLSVAGNTVDVGLTTFPTIVRSGGVGLRRSGNLAKKVFL